MQPNTMSKLNIPFAHGMNKKPFKTTSGHMNVTEDVTLTLTQICVELINYMTCTEL